MPANPHIAIVGAGITGLATAWYLQQEVPHATITVFERQQRVGGKIHTIQIPTPAGPATIEAGPDAMLTTKPWAIDLITDIGLADQLIPTNPRQRTVYVLRDGKLHALPAGMQLIVPTRIVPFLRSSLFRWHEKLRILAEMYIPARTQDADESLQDFVVRRFGKAMLDIVAIPLMAGIYNADPTTMSMHATFPGYQQLERQHRSLIRALRAQPPTARQQSPFLSLRGGMAQLVDHLQRRLHANIRLGTNIHRLTPHHTGWHVHSTTGTVDVSHVVLTTPAHVCAPLCAEHSPELATHLASQRTISTGTVSLLIPAAAIPAHLDGFGVIIPRNQGRAFSAMTIASLKFAHRAPEPYAIVRLFFGRSTLLNADDNHIIQAAQAEIHHLLGTTPTILAARVFHWPQGNPQYDVGHRQWQHRLTQLTPPHVYFAGSSFDGIGIPDCVRQAQQTARAIASSLKESSHAHPTL